MTKYCGRIFSAAEMTQIRQLIIDHPEYHRLALSQLLWYRYGTGAPHGSLRAAKGRTAPVQALKRIR